MATSKEIIANASAILTAEHGKRVSKKFVAEVANAIELALKQEIYQKSIKPLSEIRDEKTSIKALDFNYVVKVANERNGFNPKNQVRILIPASAKLQVSKSADWKRILKGDFEIAEQIELPVEQA